MKTIKVKVEGMTCSSCEVVLERALMKISGVRSVTVSRTKETLRAYVEDDVLLEDLSLAVAQKGYQLIPYDTIEEPVRPSFIVRNKKRYAEIGAAVLFLIGAYWLLQTFNLLPEGIGVTDNMSYGFVFLIGLVAATSTCIAVAGGLLLAVANKFNEANPHLTGWQKFKPHIWFNTGRIASYTLLGGAIGALGSILTISPTVTGYITIVVSILMIVMGLQLLQVFPWLNRIQLKMPKFIAHKVYDASSQEQKVPSKTTSFLFGGATFFLPCGFTQALQLYVLGTGSFTTGALVMLAFSLGTLPSLAGLGAFSSFAKGKTQRHFMTFSAVLVIVLGLFNISPGLTLVGASIALPGGNGPNDASNLMSNLPSEQDVQIVNLEIRGLDYHPSSFVIKKGVPVEWRVDGRSAIGCAQILSVPDLGITQRLSGDQIKTIHFTPQETGKIMFSCSMGMAGPGLFEVIA